MASSSTISTTAINLRLSLDNKFAIEKINKMINQVKNSILLLSLNLYTIQQQVSNGNNGNSGNSGNGNNGNFDSTSILTKLEELSNTVLLLEQLVKTQSDSSFIGQNKDLFDNLVENTEKFNSLIESQPVLQTFVENKVPINSLISQVNELDYGLAMNTDV